MWLVQGQWGIQGAKFRGTHSRVLTLHLYNPERVASWPVGSRHLPYLALVLALASILKEEPDLKTEMRIYFLISWRRTRSWQVRLEPRLLYLFLLLNHVVFEARLCPFASPWDRYGHITGDTRRRGLLSKRPAHSLSMNTATSLLRAEDSELRVVTPYPFGHIANKGCQTTSVSL